MPIVAKREVSQNQNRIASNVDPDETVSTLYVYVSGLAFKTKRVNCFTYFYYKFDKCILYPGIRSMSRGI